MSAPQDIARTRYGSFWQRFAASWIDRLVFMPLFVAQAFVESQSRGAAFVLAIPVAAASVGYSIWFHGRGGRTPGKRVMGIRVVRTTGEPIGWRQAWMRSSVDVLFAAVGVVGSFVALSAIADADYYGTDWMHRATRLADLQPEWLAWSGTAAVLWTWSEVVVMLFNSRRRALHDLIAGTIVVSDQPSQAVQPQPAGAYLFDTGAAP